MKGTVEYLDEFVEVMQHQSQAIEFLSALVNELNVAKGSEGRQCLECAKERIIVALEMFDFFHGLSIKKAMRVLEDPTENKCEEHQ